MGLFKVFCSVLVLAVVVDIALGQGYGGRQRPRRCPPVCRIFCKNGNVLDNNGCPTCKCNPDSVIIEPFPPTVPTPCPPGSVQDGSNTICQPFGFPGIMNTQCRSGSFCSGGPADEPGRCCVRKIVDTHPHCPAVRTTLTACGVRFNSCDSTRPCPNGYKCCPRGCGNRCVPAFGDLYRPNRPIEFPIDFPIDPRIPRRMELA